MEHVNAAAAQATIAWTRFDAWAGEQERTVALLAHPGFPYDTRPTQGWPLTRLSAALAISAAYVVLLAYGVAVRKPAAKAVKEVEVGVLASIAREPIKALQIVYNAVQVRAWRACACACGVRGTLEATPRGWARHSRPAQCSPVTPRVRRSSAR